MSLPSRSWVNVWAARNGFRVAKAKEIALERIKAANPDLIKNWLLFYEELFNRDARLLYNADETFLNFKRDYRSIACGLANPVTPEDKGSHMTAMVCFSSSGDVIKPMIILPGIKNVPQNLNEYEDQALFTASRKGWMTTQLWEVWVMNFVSEIKIRRLKWPKKIRNEKVLLIVDGHSSRSTPDALKLLRENDIELLVLPAHLTHLLQPFDVGIAGTLKMLFRKSLIELKTRFFSIEGMPESSKKKDCGMLHHSSKHIKKQQPTNCVQTVSKNAGFFLLTQTNH